MEEESPWKYIALPWVSLPLFAVNCLIAWNEMPERVPMKYGRNGVVTSWATRSASMGLMFKMLLFVVIVSSVMLGLVQFQVPWRLKPASLIVTLMSLSIAVLLAWVMWTRQMGA